MMKIRTDSAAARPWRCGLASRATRYTHDSRMSVEPALSLTLRGLPLVRRYTSTKLLKLKAKLAINSGLIDTSSSGNVILRNAVNPLAPSTYAASLRSRGMLCRAPVLIRNMYG